MKELEYELPGEIEKRSFEIIGQELKEMHITIPADEEPVTKRVIHTSADFEYAHTMTYSKNAVQIATTDCKWRGYCYGYEYGAGWNQQKSTCALWWSCALFYGG